MNYFRVLASLFLLFFFGSTTVFAIPMTWTLQDVTFDDGGTASGSYQYDADTDLYSNIDVTTTTTASFDGSVYNFLRPGSGSLDYGFTVIDVVEADMSGNQHIAMVLIDSMTNAGGSIDFGANGGFAPWEGYCAEADCTTGFIERNIVGGSVFGVAIEVPEPSTFILLWSGLIGLGLSRRRKNKVEG